MFRSKPKETFSTTNLAAQFHNEVYNNKALLICFCPDDASGCLENAKNLKAYFPKLDWAHVRVVQPECAHAALEYEHTPQFNALLGKMNTYVNILFTGCETQELPPAIMKNLISFYPLSKLKSIFMVIPPLHSKALNDDYSEGASDIRNSFKNIKFPVHVVSLGIDCHPHSIGLPKPYLDFDIESKYKLPENCYGLMHAPNAIFDEESYGLPYLKSYFEQVVLAGRHRVNKTKIIVIAIEVDRDSRTYLDRVAASYNIKIMHYSSRLPNSRRLPPVDFIQALKLLAAKRGIISCDGIQTLLQVLYLGLRPFVYFHSMVNGVEISEKFYEELAAAVPHSMWRVVRVMLGLCDNFSLLQHAQLSDQVLHCLQSISKKAEKRFETYHAAAKAQPKLDIAGSIASAGAELKMEHKEFTKEQTESKEPIVMNIEEVKRTEGQVHVPAVDYALRWMRSLSDSAIDDLAKELALRLRPL